MQWVLAVRCISFLYILCILYIFLLRDAYLLLTFVCSTLCSYSVSALETSVADDEEFLTVRDRRYAEVKLVVIDRLQARETAMGSGMELIRRNDQTQTVKTLK